MINQRILRFIIGLTLTILLILHASNNLPIPFLHTLENLSYDTRLKMTVSASPGSKIDKKVVIIDIDEKSMEQIGQWPWDRHTMANIVDNLFDHYQINTLGFDIIFAEKDEDPTDQILVNMSRGPLKNNPYFINEFNKALPKLQRDKRLAESLKNRKVVLGIFFDNGDNTLHKGQLPSPLPDFPADVMKSINMNKAQGYAANLSILQDAALTAGYFDNPTMGDGVFRKVPLLQEYNGRIYESLALAVSRTALNKEKIQLGLNVINEQTDDKILEWIKIGETTIPVDESASILVPYIGKQRSFDYISAYDIATKNAPKDLLVNKIALFGTSAAGLLDLRTTPLEAAYPGVEVHANIVQGILDQTIKNKPGYIMGFEVMLLILLGVILAYLLPRMSPLWNTIITLATLCFVFAINLYAWNDLQTVLPLATPTILVLLLYILNMAFGFFVESRGKHQLTHLFGQYVPPELVDEMSRNLTKINLDGEIREMSVLFTDVRNFTTISENMEPRELTQFINSFLTPLTRVLHHNRGTIDKYMGDAIMAFWGAPLHDPNHARNALMTGIEMVRETRKLQEIFKTKGWPEIQIGVGINTGPMNVGNKGSEFRVDYTVLGDAVNLGSRLEALTKVYGVDIITSESTIHAVPEFEYRELDLVRVKGKDRPVKIYEPLGLIETIDKKTRKTIKAFHHALGLYRQQKWDDAEKALFMLKQQEPERLIYQIYLDRIAYFRNNPPGQNWDGVFTHTSK
ncbi:MAG: adenylate/guanylate cyclase domain-containing protein [Gammaproteobacteria bacterium]|nr:adenylate/guanylate cyclase domain-containing protein [Gammaproteobacteria bacterium]MCW8910884.1 adenylate/guanylate cyclase domain-containing protein [Gammaproteobacteria bacterium]MCW9005100.1 adenylate/guanylate cyclase domain-containing protein [Gammaproteobacteria bacterium]MCW9057173.1 adenylate/guanylate cyclase domain-containing protein [Gammaproteobacteria bacterium]